MKTTETMLFTHVHLAKPSACESFGSGRMTTREDITLYDMAAFMGPPHSALPESEWYNYDDEKVTASWYFNTPRGPVTIRDYYWHDKGTLTIAGHDMRALLWIERYLDLRGIGKRAA